MKPLPTLTLDPADYKVIAVAHRTYGQVYYVGQPSSYNTTWYRYPAQASENARKREVAKKIEIATVKMVFGTMRSEVPTFKLQPTRKMTAGEIARYNAPYPADISKMDRGTYDQVDLMRLLNRADAKAYPYALAMLERMWARQTLAEQHRKDAIEDNWVGFNKPDSYKAADLRDWAAAMKAGQGTLETMKILHFRISDLLMKYTGPADEEGRGGQLQEILNIGAKKHGYALKTNPRR